MICTRFQRIVVKIQDGSVRSAWAYCNLSVSLSHHFPPSLTMYLYPAVVRGTLRFHFLTDSRIPGQNISAQLELWTPTKTYASRLPVEGSYIRIRIIDNQGPTLEQTPLGSHCIIWILASLSPIHCCLSSSTTAAVRFEKETLVTAKGSICILIQTKTIVEEQAQP